MAGKTVWKFPVETRSGDQVFPAPKTAKVVHFGLDGSGNMGVWFEMYLQHVVVKPRVFEIFGTGYDVPDEAEHVGTLVDGYYVWHLYEKFGSMA